MGRGGARGLGRHTRRGGSGGQSRSGGGASLLSGHRPRTSHFERPCASRRCTGTAVCAKANDASGNRASSTICCPIKRGGCMRIVLSRSMIAVPGMSQSVSTYVRFLPANSRKDERTDISHPNRPSEQFPELDVGDRLHRAQDRARWESTLSMFERVSRTVHALV